MDIQDGFSNAKISRRGFFRTAVGVAAGAVLLNWPQMTFAKSRDITPVTLAGCPQDPLAAAKCSALVRSAYQSILETVKRIKKQGLQAQVLEMIQNPAPTLMMQYPDPRAVAAIYRRLETAGFVDPVQVQANTLFPPQQDPAQAPQSFLSAPGSGYGSHHGYPGGLAMHTATNLSIAMGLVETYCNIYGYMPDQDVLIASEALHDLHKPWVFQWNQDGSCRKEMTIAGTGAHHILSLAESMYRKLPAAVITAQACAHNHPGSEKDEAEVVRWIKAAAILAGKDPLREGFLDQDGNHLLQPQHQEGYLTHLADHDWVLSVPAAQRSVDALAEVARRQYGMTEDELQGQRFHVFRNYLGAQLSFMKINYLASSGQMRELTNLIHMVIRP